MSKEQIFEWFYQNSSSLSTVTIIGIFAMGILIGAGIFLTYCATYTGVAYNSKFNVSNVVILLITIVLMLMISSNIVISMGMVGALSIIRFRTAIKDPRDTVFIFWSVIEGLCIGSRNNKLAIISTIIIAGILILSTYIFSFSNKYILIIRGTDLVTEQDVKSILSDYVRDCRMRNLHKNNDIVEMIFEVKVGKKVDEEMIKKMLENSNITYLNWLIEAGEMVG